MLNLICAEERFNLLWPTNAEEPKYRVRRSPKGHDMDFPSAETALMTISFLTLAVFLIKLVLVSVRKFSCHFYDILIYST